jgi:antitoxin component of MazEF toxin-antitoxin module
MPLLVSMTEVRVTIVKTFTLHKSLVVVLPRQAIKTLNVTKGQEFLVQVNGSEVVYRPIAKAEAAIKRAEHAMAVAEARMKRAEGRMCKATAVEEEASK